MENQQIFNEMMENAIAYLQEKGYIPKQPSTEQTPNRNSNEREYTEKEVTEMLIRRGLLPRK